MDQAVQELGRRVDELARDRTRMVAILASMVEGVLVVDEQGRLQHVNDAARRMLKLEHECAQPLLRRGDPPSRHRRSHRPRPGRRRNRGPGTVGHARHQPHARRAGRAGGGRRPRRRAGDARHHRSAPGRSDPPRLRGQRLARAAHAADRDQGLRRSAAGRSRRRGGTAEVSRDHPAPFDAHGAAGQGSAAAGAARCRPGGASNWRRATSRDW